MVVSLKFLKQRGVGSSARSALLFACAAQVLSVERVKPW
jgi:hypothetical protein